MKSIFRFTKLKTAKDCHIRLEEMAEEQKKLEQDLLSLNQDLQTAAVEKSDDSALLNKILKLERRIEAVKSGMGPLRRQASQLRKDEEIDSLRNSLPGKMKKWDMVIKRARDQYEKDCQAEIEHEIELKIHGAAAGPPPKPFNTYELTGISGIINLAALIIRKETRAANNPPPSPGPAGPPKPIIKGHQSRQAPEAARPVSETT